MLSEVLLRRKNKLNLPPGSGSEEATKVLLYSMLRNFETLGYSLSEDVVRVLLEYSEKTSLGEEIRLVSVRSEASDSK